MKWFYKLLVVLVLAVAIYQSPTCAQQPPNIHPKKTMYADFQQWSATAPGDVQLKAFRPFRAVYLRKYKQSSGPNKGQPREDRVIVTAEKVSWHGKDVALINITDSGNSNSEDTNARSLSMFANLEDLGVLFEIGPIPGKAKDYYVANIQADSQVVTMVTSSSGQSQTRKQQMNGAGFGPGTWAMACMDLKKGKRIRLAPVYSPPGNAITGRPFAQVLRRETYTSGKGESYEAWVIETMYGLASSRVQHSFLAPRPPYFLGTNSIDLNNGESKVFMQLQSFEYLADGDK